MSSRNNPNYRYIHITGDSFTGGLYATAGDKYRELLETAVKTLNAGNAEEFDQFAVTGGRMADQPSQLSTVFPDCDVLILALGQNDLTGGRTEAQFEADTATCLEYVRDNRDCVTLVVAVPLQPSWWPTATGTKAQTFCDILEAQAGAYGARYGRRWRNALKTTGLSTAADVTAGEATAADGYHPNNTGHLQLFEAIWADLEPLMSRAWRRAPTASRSAAVGRAQAVGRTAA